MLRRVENSGLLYNHNPICGERKWSKRQKLRLRLPITVSLRLFNYAGGGSGIRTRDTVSGIHTFQACAFNHSATPPAPGIATDGVRVVEPEGLSGSPQRCGWHAVQAEFAGCKARSCGSSRECHDFERCGATVTREARPARRAPRGPSSDSPLSRATRRGLGTRPRAWSRTPTVIRFDNVTKIYRTDGHRRTILERVSFTLKPSVSYGILGINGAGKSTMMRLIAGT